MVRMIDTNGIVIGVVDSLEDPEQLARVQVKYPHLDGTLSAWARLATLMGGAERGTFFRPEKNDEVLIAFEHGDATRPYVLGALWSKVDRPPADDGKAKDNNWRFIQSRSGHILKFDDTEGKERIEIVDKDGKRRLVIDPAGDSIELSADSGDILIKSAAGKITIEAPTSEVAVKAKEISAEATTKIEMKAPEITLKADARLTVEAGGQLVLKGAQVMIN
jgi:uncharacterized protein involved in type VI secretion and phage assembly